MNEIQTVYIWIFYRTSVQLLQSVQAFSQGCESESGALIRIHFFKYRDFIWIRGPNIQIQNFLLQYLLIFILEILFLDNS